MNHEPIRVLLVEDDEEDYLLIRAFLGGFENATCALDWISTSDEAMRRFRAHEHDVYLFNYRLGLANGMKLLRRTREVGVAAPVILLTGQGEPEVDLAALRAGVSDFLVKTEITARSLERAMRYAIERKRAEQENAKLAAFPRHNPNPVLEFGADGGLTYSNAAADELARSIGDPSLSSILPPNMALIVTESLITGRTRQCQTKRGSRSFSWSFVPIFESRVVHGYATEITTPLASEARLIHLAST